MEYKAISIPQLEPIYRAKRHETFRDLIDYAADAYGTDNAFIIKTKRAKGDMPAEYKYITYRDFKADVRAFGTGLLKSKLVNKRFAIIGKNSYKWLLAYYAVLGGLGACVPLDKGLPYAELESSLIKSRAQVLIFDREHEKEIKTLKERNSTSVSDFICMDDMPGYEPFSWILNKGEVALNNGDTDYIRLPIDPKAINILLFTSGTTSSAKAVMLSQFNVLENIYSMELVEDIRHGDVNMAFLPFHHTFGSTGQTLMLARGVTTTFCDGLKYVQKNMQEYKVSIFICVPLLIESMYKKLIAGVRKQGKEKTLERGLRISKLLLKLRIDRRRSIFSKLIREFGGALRFMISGASPLDPEVARGFESFGIKVVQGYGMTEASPVLASENPVTRRPGSIGKAMPGVELKILNPDRDGVGELIARGGNIMSGYYEDPAATNETLTGGWLRNEEIGRASCRERV